MRDYVTIQGDMWDGVAYRVYGNERYMNVLLAANQQYNDIVIFPAGVRLTCPDVDTAVAMTLPPWKRV